MEDTLSFEVTAEICQGKGHFSESLSGTKVWSHKRYIQKTDKFTEGRYNKVIQCKTGFRVNLWATVTGFIPDADSKGPIK